MVPLCDSRDVFVDRLFVMASSNPQAHRAGARHGHRWCHLWVNPGNEMMLHAVAHKIGMRAEWFQNKWGFPHYDLVPPRRLMALRYGAREVSLSEWIKSHRTAETRHTLEAMVKIPPAAEPGFDRS